MLTSDFNSVLSHNAGKLLIECSSTFTTIFIRVLNFIITSIYLCLRFSLQLYKTGNLVVKICTWYIFIFKLKIFSIFFFVCVCLCGYVHVCSMQTSVFYTDAYVKVWAWGPEDNFVMSVLSSYLDFGYPAQVTR